MHLQHRGYLISRNPAANPDIQDSGVCNCKCAMRVHCSSGWKSRPRSSVDTPR